eukprot:12790213-Alexandrium_andersonii.AAC.1
MRHPELCLSTAQEATARRSPAPEAPSVCPSCHYELEAGCPCLNTQRAVGQRSTSGSVPDHLAGEFAPRSPAQAPPPAPI